MKEVQLSNGNVLAPFFKDTYDSCPEAFLQGVMGRGFCDSIEHPTYGIIQMGNFFYLGGDGSGIQKKNILSILQNLGNTQNIHFVPLSESWNELLLQDSSYKKMIRYALATPSLHSFQTNQLISFITKSVYDPDYNNGSSNKNYIIKPINENLFLTIQNPSWSNCFTENYPDYSYFKKYAFGYVIIEVSSGKMISAASAFCSSYNSLELTIATNPNYQKQGFATAVSARMILECIKQKKVPRWDAANLTSVSIAEKLGFQFLEEYICYQSI